MDAKRHFQDLYGNTYNTSFDSILMVKFAESFHLAKSKEEGEERRGEATDYSDDIVGLWPYSETYEFSRIEIDEIITIAAGIKE